MVSVHKTEAVPTKTGDYFCVMSGRLILIVFILSVMASGVCAQTDTLPPAQGKVEFVVDSTIVKLEKGARKYKEVKGYRLQIFLGPLETVKAERNKYLALGLPYSAYIKQIVPEHALQIGDFTGKLEMEKCRSEIEAYYPDALAVVEIIEPPKFSKKPKQSQ
jgi:hypothetical protein